MRKKAKNRNGGFHRKSISELIETSSKKYPKDWTQLFRMSIRKRDNYTCKECDKKQSNITFDIHHIDFNKLNSDPNNLMTLCRKCHIKKHSTVII